MTPTLIEKLEHLERLCAEELQQSYWQTDKSALRAEFEQYAVSAHPSLVEALIGVAREAPEILFDVEQVIKDLDAAYHDDTSKSLKKSAHNLGAALSKLEEAMS